MGKEVEWNDSMDCVSMAGQFAKVTGQRCRITGNVGNFWNGKLLDGIDPTFA